MDEDVASPGEGGTAVGPGLAPAADLPTARTSPPPEPARYRPLRGLDELLDDFLGSPSAPN